MMHKTTKWVGQETNRGVYNKVYKAHLDHRSLIRCSRCPYHKRENAGGIRRGNNWKYHRKTQYRA